MRKVSQAIIVLATSLGITSSAFAVEKELVLDFEGKTFRNKTIDLKAELKEQLNINPKKINFLDEINVLAKSRRGNGQLQFIVGNSHSDELTVEGNPDDFSDQNINTYFDHFILNPRSRQSNRDIWQLKTTKAVKIYEVSLYVDMEIERPRPQPQPVTGVANILPPLVSDEAIHLQWAPINHATYYKINYNSENGFSSSLQSNNPWIKLQTITSLNSYISVQACNQLGCAGTSSLGPIKIQQGYTSINLEYPRISNTEFGLVWNVVPGATKYVILGSHEWGNLPSQEVTANWVVFASNVNIKHWFSVFACNNAGCGNPASIGPLKR